MNNKLIALSALALNVLHMSFTMDPIPNKGYSQLSRMRTFQHATPENRARLYNVSRIKRKKENQCQLMTESILDPSIKAIHSTSLIKLLHAYNSATNDNPPDLVYLRCIASDKFKSYLQTSYKMLHDFFSMHVRPENTFLISSGDTQASLIHIQYVDYPTTEVRNKITLSEYDTKELMHLLDEAKKYNRACVWECDGLIYNILHVTEDQVYSYLLAQPEVDHLQTASQTTVATHTLTQNNSPVLQQPSLLSSIRESLPTRNTIDRGLIWTIFATNPVTTIILLSPIITLSPSVVLPLSCISLTGSSFLILRAIYNGEKPGDKRS